jgi:hypothetical protein
MPSERRRVRHQLGQTSQVLGDSRQHELVLRASGDTADLIAARQLLDELSDAGRR